MLDIQKKMPYVFMHLKVGTGSWTTHKLFERNNHVFGNHDIRMYSIIFREYIE